MHIGRPRLWVALLCSVLLALSGSLGYAVGRGLHGHYEGFPVVRVTVNGQAVQGDVPAINFHGRTMVPLRFVSEALGADVGWDSETWTATVDLLDLRPELDAAHELIAQLESLLAQEPGVSGQPDADKEVEQSVLIGSPIAYKGIMVTVDRIESVPSTYLLPYQTNIYFTVANNSDQALRGPGSFHYTLKETAFEQEFNSQGYGHIGDGISWIYPGQTRSVGYSLAFHSPVTIAQVVWRASLADGSKVELGPWDNANP